MTDSTPDVRAPDWESTTDLTALEAVDDVPFHEDTDTVDAETLDALAGRPTMVVVGVETDDGVLLRRLTDDCAWKLPLAAVEPDEPYAEAARRAVSDVVGLDVRLDDVAGVWRLTAGEAGGERTAEQAFVVVRARPADGAALDEAIASLDPDDRPADVDWFTALPEHAERAPGTDLFC